MAEKQLGGKVALVTGGTRGIGAAIAKELYSLGATVIITGTKSDYIPLEGYQYICTDFSNKNSLNEFVDQVRDKKIYILVNNAGINQIGPILVNDIQMYDDFYKQYNIKVVEKEELLTNSDIVTLHVPLDDSTRNMLSAEHLSLMKPDAILINIARGGLLDEDALKQMLMNGKLGGAALDVFAIEPPTDQELLELPNFLVTPHIGGSAYEAILAMGIAAIDGLDNNKIVV